MGGGDIKLLAAIGAFLGVRSAIYVLFLSPVVSLPFALFAKIFRRAETIPFGPFIALTAAWIFLFGNPTAKVFYF